MKVQKEVKFTKYFFYNISDRYFHEVKYAATVNHEAFSDVKRYRFFRIKLLK